MKRSRPDDARWFRIRLGCFGLTSAYAFVLTVIAAAASYGGADHTQLPAALNVLLFMEFAGFSVPITAWLIISIFEMLGLFGRSR